MANIRLEQMTPIQQVAALLITLGPSAASEVMKNIEDDSTLEQITIEIAGLSKLPQDVIEAIVDEFHTVFQASSMLIPPAASIEEASMKFINNRFDDILR